LAAFNTPPFALLKELNPNHIVLHDIFDGSSISHHDMKDPFAQYRKEIKGTNSLRKEIDYVLDELGKFKDFKKSVIPPLLVFAGAALAPPPKIDRVLIPGS
jgi:hypothetical protein